VEQKRDGFAVTMSQVAALCGKDPGLSSIAHSVQMTLNDPSYLRKLQAANDLTPVTPTAPAPRAVQPSIAAAPKAPVPVAPMQTYQPGPALPGLGGSSSQMVRARALTREKRAAVEQQAKDEQK
jgi:hypothetical protein